jgi:hypothetical protein
MLTKIYVKLVAIFLMVAAVSCFIVWRVQVSLATKSPHAVIIFDRSGSVKDLECIHGIAMHSLNAPKMGRKSKLIVLATGDSESANEPKFVGEYDLPPERDSFEKPGAQALRRAELINRIEADYSKYGHSNQSTIFQSIARGIEALRARGCGQSLECHMFIRTDGQETSQSEIRRALTLPQGAKSKLPRVVDNTGIHVTFFGIAQTKVVPPRSSKSYRQLQFRTHSRAERINEVWLNLFARQELVRFEPFCPPANTAHKE